MMLKLGQNGKRVKTYRTDIQRQMYFLKDEKGNKIKSCYPRFLFVTMGENLKKNKNSQKQ